MRRAILPAVLLAQALAGVPALSGASGAPFPALPSPASAQTGLLAELLPEAPFPPSPTGLPAAAEPATAPHPSGPRLAAVAASGRAGPICGKRRIRGERLAPIPGRLQGCGISAPVRVFSVSGVALSPPAIMDCPTARALERWVRRGVRRTIGSLGGGIDGLRVIAGYSCRTRNNLPGARISEHGRGRAIDIAGFTLRNGEVLDVLTGWNDRRRGRLLKRLHRTACGPFGTVLGPDADRYHRNHLHLDTARHRGGSYCR